jgi:TPR repeat protein
VSGILRAVSALAVVATVLAHAPAIAQEAAPMSDDAASDMAPAPESGADDKVDAPDVAPDRFAAAEARARLALEDATAAAEAAEAARDAAAAELDRLTAEATALRAAEEAARAALAAVRADRQAAEADEVAGTGAAQAAVAAEEDAAQIAAEQERARIAAQAEAARIAAEEEAARVAAEEEAARIVAEEAAARIAAEEEAARVAAEEEAARVAAEEEAARIAAEEAEAARIAAAEASLQSCLDIAGAPSAEAPISEAAQRAAFQALARARADCAAAVRDLPEAGGALFHLATIAQATGDHRQAVRLYERAAEAGEAAALTRLGDYYNFGIRPIREDVQRAVDYYEQAVAGGDAAAAATLAMMHRLGRGVPRDAARQMALMTEAAEAGYHFAQYRLARSYLSGEGIPAEAQEALGLPDPVRAIPHLAAAARAGNDDAAREIAALYATGAPGLTPNPFRQFRWVSFLADKGDAPAMAQRAFLIERGIGTEYDPERAAAEYVRALETGEIDPGAMRGVVNGAVPPWDRETALAFQRILQARGLYRGALDAQVGPGTLGAARALAAQ